MIFLCNSGSIEAMYLLVEGRIYSRADFHRKIHGKYLCLSLGEFPTRRLEFKYNLPLKRLVATIILYFDKRNNETKSSELEQNKKLFNNTAQTQEYRTRKKIYLTETFVNILCDNL